jgi:hypothetical protein
MDFEAQNRRDSSALGALVKLNFSAVFQDVETLRRYAEQRLK